MDQETTSNNNPGFPVPYEVSLDKVAHIRQEISHLFSVADTTYDYPDKGQFRFRGRILYDLDQPHHFDEIMSVFDDAGFTPKLTEENGRYILTALPFTIAEQEINWVRPLVLFLLTIPTTLFAGTLGDSYVNSLLAEATTGQEVFTTLALNLWRGWPYMVSIFLILGAHEFGHYFASRYHNIPASLPYFIPFPSVFGTMGAMIFQRGPTKNVRVQFDVGASGPLAGLVVAVPILIYGLSTSPLLPLPDVAYQLEGNSVLYAGVKYLVFGQFLPSADGFDVFINQYAWAGWTGLFVTGLNLLPIGQFDGGRVTQVLGGKEILEQLHWPIILGLMAMGFLLNAPTWYVFALLAYLFGSSYDEPLDEVTQLDSTRRALAICTMVIFFLVFVPVPLMEVIP